MRRCVSADAAAEVATTTAGAFDDGAADRLLVAEEGRSGPPVFIGDDAGPEVANPDDVRMPFDLRCGFAVEEDEEVEEDVVGTVTLAPATGAAERISAMVATRVNAGI